MKYTIIAIACMGVLAGCASVLPNGPSVAVMPAPGKPFETFEAEDHQCRQYAEQSIGTSAGQAATDAQVKSIAAGTLLGAAAGALAGGHQGAGSGAGFGMLAGAAMGSGAGQYSGREAQRRYDIAYEQCMYAKGNQLPQASNYRPQYAPPPAPAPSNFPPPPPPWN
jgi:hypothetical protein